MLHNPYFIFVCFLSVSLFLIIAACASTIDFRCNFFVLHPSRSTLLHLNQPKLFLFPPLYLSFLCHSPSVLCLIRGRWQTCYSRYIFLIILLFFVFFQHFVSSFCLRTISFIVLFTVYWGFLESFWTIFFFLLDALHLNLFRMRFFSPSFSEKIGNWF